MRSVRAPNFQAFRRASSAMAAGSSTSTFDPAPKKRLMHLGHPRIETTERGQPLSGLAVQMSLSGNGFVGRFEKEALVQVRSRDILLLLLRILPLASYWLPAKYARGSVPRLLVSLLLGLGFISTRAQGLAPDAGSLRQQIEQRREQTVPPVEPPRVVPPREIRSSQGLSVTVKEIRFSGNTLLDRATLTAAVAGFVNQDLGFEDLQRAADAVSAAYREAGWIARVYFPEQDISTGVVTLQVIEARYAGLRFEGAQPQRVSRARVESQIGARQRPGQPLNADTLDRGLLLADDLPGVSVAGTLVPGQTDGETSLVLQTTDEVFVYGDLSLDNTGSRATGTPRMNLGLYLNSPSGYGELVTLNAMRTEGIGYGRVGATVPVGDDGLRLGVNFSSMSYRTIVGPRVQGRSGGAGADLNYPLVRARVQNLYLVAGVETKSFFNEALTADAPVVQGDYETSSLRLGLSGNWFDGMGGGGANTVSIQGSWGRLSDMKKHPAEATIDRSFHKLVYSLSRQQGINDTHSLYAALQGQYAAQVLDSSERFFIGGANSVRAYPASEHGGDSGYLLSLEWRWRLGPDWVLTPFVDTGRVSSNASPTLGNIEPIVLRGRGLSLGWRSPQGLTAKLTWSQRNGANPKPLNGTDRDGDGTLVQDRYWLTLSLPL